MKILLFSIMLVLNGCSSVIIADNRDYDKVKLTSSSKHCRGQCVTPSQDGKSCIVFAKNISEQCKRYFRHEY